MASAPALLHQDQRQRFADDVAAADDDDVRAVDGDVVAHEQLLHAERRAGEEARLARGQQAEAFRDRNRPRPCSGDTASMMAASSICVGSGNCTRMP